MRLEPDQFNKLGSIADEIGTTLMDKKGLDAEGSLTVLDMLRAKLERLEPEEGEELGSEEDESSD